MTQKYVAFLRGINVGGHHKVPMASLKTEFEKLGFKNIITLLNSGNIIFHANTNHLISIENTISTHLEKHFGFPVPAIIRKADAILKLQDDHPFKTENLTKDIRLYVSFLKHEIDPKISLPWVSVDESYTIISKSDQVIFSVLDLSMTKTPKAMAALETNFGTDITTRNWNTIVRIIKKLA